MGRIKQRLLEFESLEDDKISKHNPKMNELKIQLADCEAKIDALVSQIPKTSDITMKFINRELDSLSNEIHRLNEEILRLSDVSLSRDFPAITKHAEQWESISFDDKQKVVDALIQVIYVANGKIEIVWRF